MGALEEYFEQNKARVIHKWVHYLEIYERHFARFRGREVHVLEIGVYFGGSMQMWKHYFGPRARIYGVDIYPGCKQFEEDRIQIFTGDQGDRDFLRRLRDAVPKLDILIDDGGHRMEQQIATFEELFPHVAEDGVYICEDMQTSYWPDFGGGYRQPGTFVETAKGLIDQINAWYTREPDSFQVDDITRSTQSIHFYPGMAVIEKRRMEEPRSRKTGIFEWPR